MRHPSTLRKHQLVKSIAGSSRGLGFSFHHPHVGSQLLVAPIPGDPTPSSDLCGHCTHVVHRHTRKQNTYTHTH